MKGVPAVGLQAGAISSSNLPTQLTKPEAIAVSSGARDLTRLSGAGTSSLEALAGTLGAQRTAVLLVNFTENAVQPYTTNYASNVVFSATSNFDLENSYQQTWLTGDVFGWYTIPLTNPCDFMTLATQAQAAATNAGVNLSSYAHYVYAFPESYCGWSGMGSVGGSPSQAWINGSFELEVVGHEMGHNFGLYHSHSLRCATGSVGGSCAMNEYGDTLDIMGHSAYHFSAYQKERLGWLNAGVSPPVTSVTADGSYAIDAYETVGSASKALKIPRGTTDSNYYVELRQGVGYDARLLGNGNVMNGVLVHLASPSDPNSDYLLDMTPETTTFDDAALMAGQTFWDADFGVSITTLSVGSGSASVAVTFGTAPPSPPPPPPPPPSCTHVAPVLRLSPSQSNGVRPGTAVNFTVSLTNNDGSLCTASTFDLQAAVPSGWTATPGALSFSLAPGKSASKTVKVVSPKSAALGSYAINVTSANRAATAASASASAAYVISKLH